MLLCGAAGFQSQSLRRSQRSPPVLTFCRSSPRGSFPFVVVITAWTVNFILRFEVLFGFCSIMAACWLYVRPGARFRRHSWRLWPQPGFVEWPRLLFGPLHSDHPYQNTLARVVTNTSKFEHITPILKKLHWLPIKQRIDYKLCLLTYKTLQIQQLPIFTIVFLLLLTLCLQDHLIHRFCPFHMSEHLWVKGPFLSLLPRLWNSLPPDTRKSLFVSTFRSKLKTHLFKLAFPLEFSPILSSDCLPGFDSCFSFTFSPIEWYLVLDTGH